MTAFDIDPDQVRDHASTVAGVAGELSTATAGLPVLGPGALGTFVQFLATGLDEAMTQTADGVERASAAMDVTSTGLVQIANRYRDTDDGAATLLGGTGLPGGVG